MHTLIELPNNQPFETEMLQKDCTCSHDTMILDGRKGSLATFLFHQKNSCKQRQHIPSFWLKSSFYEVAHWGCYRSSNPGRSKLKTLFFMGAVLAHKDSMVIPSISCQVKKFSLTKWLARGIFIALFCKSYPKKKPSPKR